VIATALAIPAPFMDAPAWVVVLLAAALLLSVVGIRLTAPALRRRTPGPA
jgi:hypothetical protein